MCQIDQREGTVSFAAIRRVLRELFAKKHGGHPTPLQVRGLKSEGSLLHSRRWGVNSFPMHAHRLLLQCNTKKCVGYNIINVQRAIPSDVIQGSVLDSSLFR